MGAPGSPTYTTKLDILYGASDIKAEDASIDLDSETIDLDSELGLRRWTAKDSMYLQLFDGAPAHT